MEKLKLVPIYSTTGFETLDSVVAQGQVAAGIIESLLINKNQKTMKKYALIIISIIISSILLSCTKDGNELDKTLTNVKGTIAGTVSCQTESNGLTYEIQINNLKTPRKIITGNLPNEFKQNNLKINFDMKRSIEGIGACVQIYGPAIFYEITNITLTNTSNP